MAKLTIDIEARLAQFQDSMNRVERTANKTSRSIDSAFGKLNGTLAKLGLGISAGALVAFGKSAIDAFDDIGKASQRVGVSVESLSAFRFAADLADVSVEEFNTGLRQLAKSAADAQSGTGDAKRAFDDLKISVIDTSGNLKGTEELLLDVADRFAGIEDGTFKTANAMRIFGRGGAQLIPLLNGGRAGFEKLRAEAERLGLIMSTETAKSVQEFNDNMRRVTSQVDALKISLAEGLLPSMSSFLDLLVRAQKVTGGDFIRSLGLAGSVAGADTLQALEREDRLLNALILNRRKLMDSGGNTSGIESQILAQEQRVEFIRGILESRGFGQSLGDTGIPQSPALRKAPRPGGDDDARKQQEKFDAELDALNKQADALKNISQIDKTIADIESGRTKARTESEREQLRIAASRVDIAKQEQQIQSEIASILEKIESNEGSRLQRLGAEIQRLNELALPEPETQFERTVREIEAGRIAVANEFERNQLLNAAARVDVANEEKRINEEIIQITERAALAELSRGNQVDKTKSTMQELGFVAASAFEDAIIQGNRFSDVLKGILQDIARIILRKNVSDPIAGAIGNFDFGELFRDSTPLASAAAASGVISPMESGGIVTKPTLSLIGEGSMNEAVVPLPDGRSIPISGNIGGGDVVVNVINQSSAQVSESRETTGPNGTRVIELIVKDAVRSLAGRGELDQTFAQFGARRAPVF